MVNMNTTLQRLNAVTALSTSCILALLALVAFVSHPTHPRTPSKDSNLHPKVIINSLRVVTGRNQWNQDRAVQHFANANFDLDADFTKLFNWNTKQVFLSLEATWENNKYGSNHAVIWDRIIKRKEDAHVVLEYAVNKYGFREMSKSFKNIPSGATFTLKWNTMPHVGLLAYGDEFITEPVPFELPNVEPGDAKGKIVPEKMWY